MKYELEEISSFQCTRHIELYNIDAVHKLKKCFQNIPLYHH